MEDDVQIDPALAAEPPADAVEPEPFALPDDFATQVQAWDIDLAKLPDAVDQYKRLQTDEGVVDGFIAMGQALGFGLKELNTLFAPDQPPAPAAPAAPAAPVEPVDPEALMTRAEVDAMIAGLRESQEAYVQQQAEREEAAKKAQVTAGINGWFGTAGVEDDQTRKIIANFGEKHIAPGADPYDMRVVSAALERGKADYEAYLQGEAQKYLQVKAASVAAQPTPVGGAPAGSTGNEDVPVDYAAAGNKAFSLARDRVRQKLRDSGELS